MKFRVYLFNTFKYVAIIISSFILFIIWSNISFPIDAFALSPEAVVDYYGNTEYVGKDPYGHFHNPASTERGESIITTSIDAGGVQDSYGTNPPYEKDWYSGKDSSLYMSNTHSQNSYSLYDKLRMRLHWYSWKKYSSEYESFNQFKTSWNPSISMRKEIMEVFKK